MNALKAHERHLVDLAEQERQLEKQRIENMTPEERAEYEEECRIRQRRLQKDLAATGAVLAMLSHTPYRY